MRNKILSQMSFDEANNKLRNCYRKGISIYTSEEKCKAGRLQTASERFKTLMREITRMNETFTAGSKNSLEE